MTRKIISFIVPVYNVEAYLEECVRSIAEQMTEACELILVDDGSTDGSGAVCDRYAQQRTDVIVIHQPNRGHSAARNAGLDKASGEYVAFVDSDDYIAAGSVGALLEAARGGVDICFLKACKFFPDGSTQDLGDGVFRDCVHQKSREAVLKYLASRPKYPGSACTKLFRREFLQQHALRFPTDLLHGEDLSLCLEALTAAQTFDALDAPYYYYRQNRPGSVTTKVGKKSFFDLAAFVKKYGKPARDDVQSCALAFVAYEYSILLWQYSLLPKDAKSEAMQFLRAYRWVLKHGASRKLRVIRKAVSVLGIGGVSRLLAFYMARRK